MNRSFARWLRALWLVLAAGAATAAQDAPPPPFAPGPVVDTFFGTRVPDPYRALEKLKSPRVAAWMKAQSAFARRTLDSLGRREEVLASLAKYEEAVPARVSNVWRIPDGRLFLERRGPGDDQFKLYTRDPSGAEAMLVDPEHVAGAVKGAPHAINWIAPSPDGRHVAYGLSAGGSEDAFLHVVDSATGRQVGGAIPRAEYGGVSWAPDGKSLYFIQLARLAPGAPPRAKYLNARVVRLPLGGSQGSVRPVLGPGSRGVKIAPEESPFVSLTADGRFALASISNGVQREQRLYAAEQAAFLAGRPHWTLLFDRDAGIVSSTYAQGTLYAITHADAPRYRVIAGPVQGFDAARAATIVPEGERVLSDLAAASDAIYVEAREGNLKRLFALAHRRDGAAGDDTLRPVALPVEGSFALNDSEGGGSAADPRLPGLLLDLQGWTRARQIYEVAADGSVRNTGLQPAGPFDAPEDLVATELQCRSHDGVLVPMSVIHRKGIAFDGSHPTLLYGYAAYGITEEPWFSTATLSWIDAGGVFAVANPRGSGVYGEDWYKAGFQATKPNTWKDFIACAETLIAQRVTAPSRLGIWGGSAGGILVGRALTERPDLFAAAVPEVGALDMLRFETEPNGLPNVPEFGSVKTEAGFRALLEMSTLHQIKDGVDYPGVLFVHGVNDPRVTVWNSTKTAARLMAATRSGRPVLLRLDYASGHGIGDTKAQRQAETADIFAFLLWQMGVEGAGPR